MFIEKFDEIYPISKSLTKFVKSQLISIDCIIQAINLSKKSCLIEFIVLNDDETIIN